MEFRLADLALANPASDCLVVGVYEDNQLTSAAAQLDTLSQGYLPNLLKTGDLTGKLGQSLLLHNVPNVAATRVLLLGCGKPAALSDRQYKQIVQKMAQTLGEINVNHAVCALTELSVQHRTAYWNVRFAIEAVQENQYRYDEFKRQKAPNPTLTTLHFACDTEQQPLVEKAILEGQAVAYGVKCAKDVANCPPNVCNPKYLSELAVALGKRYANITTSVIDEKEMSALGMHSYLAVSRGSANPAFMSVIEYKNHPNPSAKPIVLVGKGLTFDSGGISIKPSEAMDEMKYDMGGAASVYGTMQAIAQLNLPLNVIGVLAGCENMPDGNAYRPGDILTTMSGLTVEVLNTDAEGRLVLCDVLTYVKRFNPELVIDIATLTGACIVALGHHTSGLLSTDNQIADQLLQAAEKADDRTWRLPLGEEYQEMLKSNFADLANIGGRFGGAITAGQFLSNFTQDYPWAHLDIAGTAWKSGAAKGATGRPVPLLTQFLIDKVAQPE